MDKPVYFDLLGYKAKDMVTGFSGVIDSVSYDLYGCVQVIISPPAKDVKREQGCWFDAKRVKIMGKKPVMPQQDFFVEVGEEIGCSDKPAR